MRLTEMMFEDNLKQKSYLLEATITPKMAGYILDKCNTENRSVSAQHKTSYANSILSGNWVCNGETIVLDKKGTLRNGQHRLLGCIMAGKSFKSDMRFGVSPNSYQTIDIGKSRTNSNLFSIKYPQLSGRASTMASGVALVLWRLKNDLFKTIKTNSMRPDLIVELYDIADQHIISDIVELLKLKNTFTSAQLSYTNAIVALYLRLFEIDSAKAKEYFSQLSGLKAGRTALNVTTRLRSDCRKDGRENPTESYVMAIIIIGWNAFIKNKKLARQGIRITADGKFPVIKS